jgi:putative aminopeptidase FrvX
MVRLVEEAAKKKGIALQRSASIGALTYLSYVQLEGAGVMCVDLGFPGRYTHSPHETVDLGDIEQLALLIREALAGIAPDFDFSRNL